MFLLLMVATGAMVVPRTREVTWHRLRRPREWNTRRQRRAAGSGASSVKERIAAGPQIVGETTGCTGISDWKMDVGKCPDPPPGRGDRPQGGTMSRALPIGKWTCTCGPLGAVLCSCPCQRLGPPNVCWPSPRTMRPPRPAKAWPRHRSGTYWVRMSRLCGGFARAAERIPTSPEWTCARLHFAAVAPAGSSPASTPWHCCCSMHRSLRCSSRPSRPSGWPSGSRNAWRELRSVRESGEPGRRRPSRDLRACDRPQRPR